jgi:small redox-active disulfide protein 2
MADVEVTRIRVGKHSTGIIGLKETLAEVAAEMPGAPDEELYRVLLDRLSRRNYIADRARDEYGQAFLREYKKFVGEPFQEPGGGPVEIKVLGRGCPRCDQLERDLMGLIAELNLDADLEHVRDLAEIGRYGLMGSPGLVIDGEVKAVGSAPPKEKLKSLLQQAASRRGQ